MNISAKNLAKHLGVSPATISIVFNNGSGVSEKTKLKVLKAAKELGYQHNTKSYHSNENSVIQLCIYKKHGQIVNDTPFFSELLEGISLQVTEYKYNLHITYLYENQDLASQILRIKNNKCVGLIILATEMLETDIDFFNVLHLPMVILDNYFEHKYFDSVLINNIQSAYAATMYLIEMGHTEIGYIASSLPVYNFKERRKGYCKAISTLSNEKFSLEEIVNVFPTSEGAYKDFRNYLSSNPKLPTAFFAENDIICAACMKALIDEGYHLPEDVSFVGFDDIPLCEFLTPKLSTINVPKRQIGITAVNRLFAHINNCSETIQKVEVSSRLIIRNSVKKLN